MPQGAYHREASEVEEWRPIHGWEDFYEVSDRGQIRSLDRWVERRGRGTRLELGRVLQLTMKAGSHVRVSLRGGGRRWSGCVHRLVLEAFVGPRPPGMECCHNDGDATNNRLSNLRWDTKRANAEDARRHGGMVRGSGTYNAKLTEADIPIIRAMSAAGTSQRQVAAKFGVTPMVVNNILKGRRWKHVP